jgi:hypothetical protein
MPDMATGNVEANGITFHMNQGKAPHIKTVKIEKRSNE